MSDFERIADFIAQDTYREELMPNGRVATYAGIDENGRSIHQRGEHRQVFHGHEIKVSRSDWLAELKDPTKAQAWLQYCDKFWLVAPVGIVHPGELPQGWGLMTPNKNGVLQVKIQAPLLDPAPMPTHTFAQLMRAIQKTAALQVLAQAA